MNTLKLTSATLPQTLNAQQYQYALNTHKSFLKKFKTLPNNTRKSTYKQLLILPNNYSHLQQLTKPYQILPQHGNNKQVAIITNILAKLYPQLQNQWIPSMIHPFVKLFQQDFTFAFQCSLTFLLNWGKPILYDFPNCNKQIIDIFQQCLPNLKNKIQTLNYPLSSLINPIFVVSLTDILNKKDWLQICDFWITNPFQPWLYISTVIAILQLIQDRLLQLHTVQDMSLTLRKQKNIPMDIITQKSKQIANKYKAQFLNIYKESVFPLQVGRYPVHKFFRAPIRKSNSKLQVQQNYELQLIKQKYEKLQNLLKKFINQGHVSDQQAIENKYQIVQGQVRQYLNLIRQQHSNKIQALRDVQSKFNSQLQSQGQNREPKTSTIEKRARLQRQIQLLLNQADSIKQMEDQMMKRMYEALKIKKKQLKKINETFKVQ